MANSNLEEILAEYDRISELYEEAAARDDDELMIKYGNQVAELISVNYEVLNLPEDYVTQYKKNLAEYEKSVVEERIAAKKAEESKLKADDARDKYYDALLEQKPDGKNRTTH